MKTLIEMTEPDTDYQFGDVLTNPRTSTVFMYLGVANEYEFYGRTRRNLKALILTDSVFTGAMRGTGVVAQISDSGWRLER